MPRAGSRVVRLGGEEYRVDVAENGEIRVAGVEATFRVARQDDGTYVVSESSSGSSAPDPGSEPTPGSAPGPSAPPRRWRAAAMAGRDRQVVFVHGEVYEVAIEAAGSRRRAAAHAQVEMLSVPMPARVVKILVAPGQAVKRGDVVAKLEAMKMELPLRAPRDGTVRSVDCREGDLVQPGVSVLEIA